ncbi:MAG: type II toxin-antitoxin system VapC family toxin [Burkholderiales bacterium]
MRLLLDTHVALWALVDSPRLSAHARELILEPVNEVWVSAGSVWEIAIKHGLGRGDMPVSGEEALAWFRRAGYRLLPIAPEHAAAVGTLPPIHGDPFDRLLVAQARIEPFRLLSANPQVVLYGEGIVRV